MHFIALGNTSPPASSCRASPFLVAKSLDLDKLPGSDTVYDKLSWRNFKDIDKWFPALSIRKTFKSDLFSETLKADLPLKVVFAANLLTYDKDKEEFKRFPKANVTANLRILDLGSSDGRNPGFLNYQYKIDTDKRVSHIFDIDRVAPFFKLDHTRFYGHVRYKYTNASKAWGMESSFGLQQHVPVKVGKIKLKPRFRVGMSPEGQAKYGISL
mmetsp:Transcript_13374/g.33949  ORF Transcript_13374/g.33949 Transcript_13374/m.33949 type:complete len:213 (+) Transcript_13374:500-1138(+)